MNFYSVTELKDEIVNIYDNVCSGGEVVITNNGKPSVLMLNIVENNLENIMRAVRQAKAMTVFNEMRAIAADNGYMSDEEIENEIACVRREKRSEIKICSQ